MKVRNSSSSSPPDSRLNTLLGDGLVLIGQVNFIGGLQVDGNVKGTLKAKNDSEAGQLIVGESGQVEGNIDAPVIEIKGTVKGNVCSNKSINLGSTAVIEGDITYQTLEICPGAVVNGKLLKIEEYQSAAVSDITSSTSRKAS